LAAIKPPPRLTASQWVEANIFLPPGQNETEPGRVKFERRPYLREILDRMTDPQARDIVFVAPTRIGKTFLLRMAWAYGIAADPGPSGWYDQSIGKARSVSIKELRPLVETNEVLKSRKPANRHHYTNLFMLFPGAAFEMNGAQTAGQVAGDTYMRIYANETDKWGDASDKEAAPIELVRHRTESFDDRRKHIYSSTPTLETGTIWEAYLRGDQRIFQVICPDCGTAIPLIWDQLKWDQDAQIAEGKWDLERVQESAYYECQSCGSRWTERMRRLAIEHRDCHYKATNAHPQPGWFTYQVNGLYGPFDSNSCGALAADFLSSRSTGFYINRQDFWNSRMGLPWKDDVTSLTQEKFAAREAACIRGDLPDGFAPDLLLVGVDVQTYGLPYVVEAYQWNGRYHTLDHGLASSWADLEAVQRAYTDKFKSTSRVITDINFEDRRAETLEAIYRRQHLGWFGAEGFEKAKDLVRIEKANPFMGGKMQGAGFTVQKLIISTYEFKVELEKDIGGESGYWTTYQLPLIASDADHREQRDYYAQLMDERRVPRRVRVVNKPPYEFKSRNGNNHFWDCKVYCKALFFLLSRQRAYGARNGSGEPRKNYVVKQS
jgi:phage terminase large subunit GpA-like protein